MEALIASTSTAGLGPDTTKISNPCEAHDLDVDDPSLLPSQWNIDKYLGHFVGDVAGFRSQMASCDALISGSFALQFFGRFSWHRSDLDMNIQQGREDSLERYLLEVEGYQLLRSTDGNRYKMIGVDKIRTLVKRTPTATETQIQICVSHGLPVEQILTGFYSTHLVNFISWNKAYSLFPVPTFVEKKGYMLQKLTEHLGEQLAKYQKRGWKIQDVVWEGEDTVPALEGLRRVGDHHTWIIPLNTTNIKASKTPDFVLEYTNFSLKKLSGGSEGETGYSTLQYYRIEAKEQRSEVLRFKYLSGCDGWTAFFRERVLRLTEIELYKEDPYLRPHNFRELIREPSSSDWKSFPKTERWTYYDEEVPKWYAQWQRLDSQKTEGKVAH